MLKILFYALLAGNIALFVFNLAIGNWPLAIINLVAAGVMIASIHP